MKRPLPIIDVWGAVIRTAAIVIATALVMMATAGVIRMLSGELAWVVIAWLCIVCLGVATIFRWALVPWLVGHIERRVEKGTYKVDNPAIIRATGLEMRR